MDHDDRTAKMIGYFILANRPEVAEEVMKGIEARQEMIKEEYLLKRDNDKVESFAKQVRENHLSMVNRVKEWIGYGV